MAQWSIFEPPFLGMVGHLPCLIMGVHSDPTQFLISDAEGSFRVVEIDAIKNAMRYDSAADKWYDVSAGEQPL